MQSIISNSKMCDCIIVGMNDYDLDKYSNLLSAIGKDSGAFRDFQLAVIEKDGKLYRALDIFSKFREPIATASPKRYHNLDFIWPTILYLGSYLSKRGFSFDYINLFQDEKARFEERLKCGNIMSVAISTTLYVIAEPIIEIVQFVRTHNTTCKIIVGGPFINNNFKGKDAIELEGMCHLLGADIYVDSAEGEATLANVLSALKSNKSLEGIQNVTYRQGNQFRFGEIVREFNRLEEAPIDYRLFPKEHIGQFVSLRTAKSCPFACSFCGFPSRAGKYSYTSVKEVERELNAIRELDCVSTLTFLDDTFNVPPNRFKEILRMMIRNKYEFRWNSFLRSDYADDEAIELMRSAGCEGVFMGVESGSDSMLQKMNKTARVADYRRVILRLKAVDIFSHANLIVGFPGETIDTFLETFEFIETVRPDTFRAQLWYADPHTPVCSDKGRFGIRGSGFNWSHETMDCRMACDLVEYMFLAVQNSLWLPQNGFEEWSVFYLKRFGLSVAAIKDFIGCFNSIVRERLVCSNKTSPVPGLEENLKASINGAGKDKVNGCSFTPNDYALSEEFWRNELGSISSIGHLFKVSGRECLLKESRGEIPAWILKTNDRVNENRAVFLLACVASAVSFWTGEGNVLLATQVNEFANPLLLHLEDNMSIAEIAALVRDKLQVAGAHAPFGFHALRNLSYSSKGKHVGQIVFDCGVRLTLPNDLAIGPETSSAWTCTRVEETLKLKLEIEIHVNDLRWRVVYDSNYIKALEIAEFESILESILIHGKCERKKRMSADTGSGDGVAYYWK